MDSARVMHLFISPVARGPMLAMDQVRAVAGRGLEGDRYFKGEGTFSATVGRSGEITLIEMESLEALQREVNIHLLAGEPRRNVVTHGVRLNDLVGRNFCVGGVLLRGVRLCQPCDHLELLTQSGVKQALFNRGGLRAQIVRGGTIGIGDVIMDAGAAEKAAAAAAHDCGTPAEYGSRDEFQRILSLLSA